MLRSALIVLVGVGVCVCMPPKNKEASPASADHSTKLLPFPSPTSWNKSIFEHMNANEQVTCPIKNIFSQSKYAKGCEGIKFPNVNANLTFDDPMQFLCTGVYDRIVRICYLDSRTIASVIPESSNVFDNQVTNLFPKKKDDDGTINFCKLWKNNYPARYTDLTPWIEQLDKASSRLVSCIKICTNAMDEFNPLCPVLAAMDFITEKISKELNASKQETPKVIPVNEKNDKENVAATSVAMEHKQEESKAVPPSPEVKAEPPKVKNTAKVAQADKIEDKKEIVNHDVQQSPPVHPPLQEDESVPENPTPQVDKSAELPPVIRSEETVEKEKAKNPKDSEAPVVPEPVAPVPQPDPNSVNKEKKTDIQPSSAQEPPLATNDVIVSHEDAGEDVIPENEGEISQHTQDQENPEAGDEMSEIEPPRGPAGEDIDESPAMPSEKHGYIPRLPGIRNDDDSHFFGYFTVIGVICIAGYVGYHNKQKILAMVVEGRRSRGGRGRRRPSTANYRKLDCTLEEAVTSQCNSNVTHVIY